MFAEAKCAYETVFQCFVCLFEATLLTHARNDALTSLTANASDQAVAWSEAPFSNSSSMVFGYP